MSQVQFAPNYNNGAGESSSFTNNQPYNTQNGSHTNINQPVNHPRQKNVTSAQDIAQSLESIKDYLGLVRVLFENISSKLAGTTESYEMKI